MSLEYTDYERRMKRTCEFLSEQLAAVRAGKANPAVLDRITVEYYGTDTPINKIASISTPDARSLLIQPWDASALKSVEKAILASDLGINPQNDGRAIRLIFPQLTEERRRELAKQVKKYAEEAKVAVRNIRRREVQGREEKIRDHRGRPQDRREGSPEAHRRLHQGSRQDRREQREGTHGALRISTETRTTKGGSL